MKTRKHIYSIDPKIGHERRECDDGTYRDFTPYTFSEMDMRTIQKNSDNLELLKTQIRICEEAWNDGMSNVTFRGKLKYIFTGKI